MFIILHYSLFCNDLFFSLNLIFIYSSVLNDSDIFHYCPFILNVMFSLNFLICLQFYIQYLCNFALKLCWQSLSCLQFLYYLQAHNLRTICLLSCITVHFPMIYLFSLNLIFIYSSVLNDSDIFSRPSISH